MHLNWAHLIVNEIAQIRQKVSGEIFDYQVLLDVLSGYSKPRDKITKLLAASMIVRVKKGLYCFGDAFRREPVSREHLANLLYGPSYVSLEYALSYHGLIPERVETVTSVTTRRSRQFDTTFGTFTYRMLNEGSYAVGALLTAAGKTTFLLATPEKALLDKVWVDKRFGDLHVSDYGDYLSDGLRIDHVMLAGLDRSRLNGIARAYDSAKIARLVRYLTRDKAATKEDL